MLTLLIKDFKLLFSTGKSKARRFLDGIFSVIMTALIIAIEVFLFSAILTKIKSYSGAPETFTCLFLAVISVLMMANGVLKAMKLFFNKKDIDQLANHPVSDGMMISSKLIFLFLNHYATAFLFTFPIFTAYGIIFRKTAWFFYMAIFYPVASFLFEVGVALLLVYPVWLLIEYLKKHVALEFAVAVVLLFAGATIYSIVLSAFVDMVANNDLNLIFTDESITKISKITSRLVPINFLVDFFIKGSRLKMTPYVCISLGIFILGTAVTVFMYGYIRHVAPQRKQRERIFKFRGRKVNIALALKELALITKNPDFIFSFSGLLAVEPFLLYLIVVAMSTIFTSGTFMYYVSLFPDFTSMISVFLVMMVTLIISSGANRYISMEASTIKNLKTIPISPKRQLIIKVLIPFIMSETALVISILVILIGRAASPLVCLFAFLLSTVLLFVFDLIAMREELHIRHAKPRSTFMSSLFAYLLPIMFVALGLVLSFVGVPIWLICLFGALIFIGIGIPVFINVWRNMDAWFMDLETQY
ncbi:MAG: hypothetical protein E7617_00020 [Ruminococcaceae bacterium]|nr:hypothetical protein [Oscillospiraceae bacterium]